MVHSLSVQRSDVTSSQLEKSTTEVSVSSIAAGHTVKNVMKVAHVIIYEHFKHFFCH